MPTPPPDDAQPDSEPTDEGGAVPNYAEVSRWLEQLQQSDRSFYNLMALEVWAIAQTMDNLMPGFWSRFMQNRQLALQEFLAQRQSHPAQSTPPESEEDGMMEGDRAEEP